jgi:tetratricopeptide (TPR) repeat protein
MKHFSRLLAGHIRRKTRVVRYFLRLLAGACAATLLFSCASGEEAAGDRAYDLAQKSSGDMRRTQLKTAYMNYSRAVKANPDKVSTKLRNRFLEMCINRAKMVLDEGNAAMDAIPLLMVDIEDQLKDDASSELRQQYAAFLVQMGDSSKGKEKYIDALKYYDRAIEKAADAAPFKEKRSSVIRDVAGENYRFAQSEFEMGKADKDDPASLIRAEYFAKVALYFDSTYKEAQKLLSECYKANVTTHSAYLSVVTDYTDTLVFRKVNKYDILLAIPTFKNGAAQIYIYGNSYNALRMQSEHFALVDVNGKQYPAAAGQKMDPILLNQEHEAKYTLRFPTPSVQIKKIIYQNGPHYTEKNFF